MSLNYVERYQISHKHHGRYEPPPEFIIAFSPNGRLFATISEYDDDMIRLHDAIDLIQLEKVVIPVSSGNISNIVFSPNSKYLFLIEWSGDFHLLDIEKLQFLNSEELP